MGLTGFNSMRRRMEAAKKKITTETQPEVKAEQSPVTGNTTEPPKDKGHKTQEQKLQSKKNGEKTGNSPNF